MFLHSSRVGLPSLPHMGVIARTLSGRKRKPDVSNVDVTSEQTRLAALKHADSDVCRPSDDNGVRLQRYELQIPGCIGPHRSYLVTQK